MIKYLKNRLKKKNKIISLIAAILMLIAIVPGPAVFSEQKLTKPEWVMPDHYPEWFHGWGKIGYFEESEIVINDIEFRVSTYATFHTPDHPSASRHEFSKGKLAGFLLDANNEVISLWMITIKK